MGVGAGPADFDEAFDELFLAARALAARMVGSRQVAEDVAAETMVRAFVHWRRIGGEEWRKAWVLRVATNISLNWVARRGRRAEPLMAEMASVEDTVVLREALAAALSALPRRQREAVVLRFLADTSEMDTAAALGMRPATVRTHLRRGLAALRVILGPSWEGTVHG